MINKQYCMSSFLAFRYVEKRETDFCDIYRYRRPELPNSNEMIDVQSAEDIDNAVKQEMQDIKDKYQKIGLLLSGGMDSAILASYLDGCDAYTFRFLDGNYQQDELHRAEKFAEYNNMNLHYVDIDWTLINECLCDVMRSKGGPVHSIEPQIYAAAKQAKTDDIDVMIIGDGADYVFGGMDGLLSKDWTFDEFRERYIYIDPAEVLQDPEDIDYLFERYRCENGIDFLNFLKIVSTEESYGSYSNAFRAADMLYFDPYERLSMVQPLDLQRIRSGESKYLIRELFKMRYDGIPVPEKNPMPRPVDIYFAEWAGPKRPEFRNDLDISRYNGNQRWLLWCLEQFLNMVDR